MMESILQWDKVIFNYINQGMSNEFFDLVMPYITDLHKFWFTYIILIPIFAIWLHKKRGQTFSVILHLILAFALADAVSYRLIKPFFERERPQFQMENTIVRTNAHTGYSFPSNHAANSFAAAITLSIYYPALAPLFILAAAIISFSRVYVGVHFPLDVTSGAMVGILCALVSFFIIRTYRALYKKRSYQHRNSH